MFTGSVGDFAGAAGVGLAGAAGAVLSPVLGRPAALAAGAAGFGAGAAAFGAGVATVGAALGAVTLVAISY